MEKTSVHNYERIGLYQLRKKIEKLREGEKIRVMLSPSKMSIYSVWSMQIYVDLFNNGEYIEEMEEFKTLDSLINNFSYYNCTEETGKRVHLYIHKDDNKQEEKQKIFDCEEYRLINYFDVWGNEKEGYEVNNLCHETDILLFDYTDYKEILQTLKEVNFLKSHVRLNMLEIYNDYDMIEIFQKRNSMPMCRLERTGNIMKRLKG